MLCYRVLYLHLEVVHLNLQHEVRRGVYASEESRGKNYPIRVITQTLRVANTTVWNVLKSKPLPSMLSNNKGSGSPLEDNSSGWPQNSVHGDEEPFHNIFFSKEHTWGGRQVTVQVYSQEMALRTYTYRRFTSRCTPLATLKNRKARLEFARKTF